MRRDPTSPRTDGGQPTPGAQENITPTPAPRRIDSSDLFAGATEVLITHQGEDYRLRHTGKGKLILTK